MASSRYTADKPTAWDLSAISSMLRATAHQSLHDCIVRHFVPLLKVYRLLYLTIVGDAQSRTARSSCQVVGQRLW